MEIPPCDGINVQPLPPNAIVEEVRLSKVPRRALGAVHGVNIKHSISLLYGMPF